MSFPSRQPTIIKLIPNIMSGLIILIIVLISSWGEPERAPLKREVGTVVHARKKMAKSGLPHTTVSLVGWFMRNDKRINYVKSIQVHM